MNRLELIEILSSASEEDVYIKAEDGLLDDFDIEQVDEQFDGFYTAFPACITLVPKSDNEHEQY